MIFYLRGKGTTFQLRNQDFPYIYAIKILKKEIFIFQSFLSLHDALPIWNMIKFFLLILPCCSEISFQVREFL